MPRPHPPISTPSPIFHLFSCLIRTQVVTGQEECVEALLQRGANVCVKDMQGRSPLHLASACGRVGALGALLQASSSSHAHLTDNQGYTPLHWACYNGTRTPPNTPVVSIRTCI